MKKDTRKSIFMQMYEGTRTNEGSFTTGLYHLFFKADMSNKRKLVEAFPDFFGDSLPEFGLMCATQEKEPDMKMNIHLHLKEIALQNLEESLTHSGEMISGLSPLIYEMLQKHQDNTQQDNNGQSCAFRFLIQFQKCNIEVLSSQSHETSPCANDLYDRY